MKNWFMRLDVYTETWYLLSYYFGPDMGD